MNLFPEITPHKTHILQVDDIHKIYIEQSGQPDGIPVIFLHGGPGAGISPKYRQFFDPKIYNIILFDQRGSGKSTPYGSTVRNTTQNLIDDIKKIMDFLSVPKAIIYGGSWGSTLGLLFAQAHPNLVISLVLRGIFLCRKSDIKWFYQHGAHQIYPDYWNTFIEGIPIDERYDLLSAFHKRIHDKDKKISHKYSKLWAEWEGRSSSLKISSYVVNQFSDVSISLAKMETHYFINDCFIKENQIIDNIEKISNIKCNIVHGRYDIVCPYKQAYDLHQAYSSSKIHIIDDAGHSLLEPGIQEKILQIFSKPDEIT
ncbi:MAG: prolyl aminopeptidase [Gammaproteobacteria bacterium]|nr:prolyl aminopeptidase [Gammaproteobacteria bacterium]|tara:strand:- start:1548 stop:2486 length:939 start_codon:yes stop_codon:yes gene_type:complete